jgi:hypothetical protein
MHGPPTPRNKLCAHVLFGIQALLAHPEQKQGNELVLAEIFPFMHLNHLGDNPMSVAKARHRLISAQYIH